MPKSFSSMFSSKSFMVSGFMFKCVIYFELIFVCDIHYRSNFFYMWIFHFLSNIYWKDFFPWYIFGIPIKDSLTIYMRVFLNSILFHWSICLFLYQDHVGLFFWGKFLITDSISIFISGLFRTFSS